MDDRAQEGHKHILVISEDAGFLNLIRTLLQAESYNVTTTNFVPNSFVHIQALQPDALIVDVIGGQAAGWDLLERLHAAASTTGIPCIVVSPGPQAREMVQAQAERYGIYRNLTRPFAASEFLGTMREMIGEA